MHAGFADGLRRGGRAGPADPDRHAADRDAARRPVAGDRRAGGALPGHRGGRLRHRRRRGGLPAHPAPGRVRIPAAGELPLHHPRRRGVRAAVDLAGDPVVRRGPARARRAHRGRHHRVPATSRRLGRLAAYVRDKRIPLELCPSSNVQTGAAPSIAEHPIGLLHDLRFRVTVNTDNRLMSGTSMSREMALLVEAFGWGWAELQWLTINAMKSRLHPVRRAAGHHQRGHQAGVRQVDRLTSAFADIIDTHTVVRKLSIRSSAAHPFGQNGRSTKTAKTGISPCRWPIREQSSVLPRSTTIGHGRPAARPSPHRADASDLRDAAHIQAVTVDRRSCQLPGATSRHTNGPCPPALSL